MGKFKLPKFMLLENPMVSDELFIYHSRKPRFIAKVDEPDIRVVEWIDLPEDLNPNRIAGLMSRISDWYRAYCDWEDDDSYKMN